MGVKNGRILRKTMDYKWVKLSKSVYFENFELKTYVFRIFCRLSEYHKIIEIGQTELEL